MKPFRYRLERLMRLKQAEKKQRVAELAQEQKILSERESDLADSRTECTVVQESYAALSRHHTEARMWEGALYALGAARQQILRRQELVRRASDHVEHARERLIQKAREAETLERLRQRRLREHMLQNQRDEQKENDDQAVTQFCRNRDSSGRAT